MKNVPISCPYISTAGEFYMPPNGVSGEFYMPSNGVWPALACIRTPEQEESLSPMSTFITLIYLSNVSCLPADNNICLCLMYVQMWMYDSNLLSSPLLPGARGKVKYPACCIQVLGFFDLFFPFLMIVIAI